MTNDTVQYNVWIEGIPTKDYSEGRKEINDICGGSSGSGSGFGCWDVSYHGLTKTEAEDISLKAAQFSFTKSVRVYNNHGFDIFIKGRE